MNLDITEIMEELTFPNLDLWKFCLRKCESVDEAFVK